MICTLVTLDLHCDGPRSGIACKRKGRVTADTFYGDNERDAHTKARAAGWALYPAKKKAYCPRCKKERVTPRGHSDH